MRLLTVVVTLAAIALAIVSWALKPNPATEAATIVVLPLVWWALGRRRSPADPRLAATRTRVLQLALLGVAIISMLDTGPELAIHVGLVGKEWLETVHRATGIAWGACLVVFGNYVPKLWRAWTCQDDGAARQRAARFAGWVFVLIGIGAIAAWTLLPESSAKYAMLALVIGQTVILLGRALLSSPPQAPAAS